MGVGVGVGMGWGWGWGWGRQDNGRVLVCLWTGEQKLPRQGQNNVHTEVGAAGESHAWCDGPRIFTPTPDWKVCTKKEFCFVEVTSTKHTC